MFPNWFRSPLTPRRKKSYETPDQGANGFYQIKNAGNLFWISALTRGDHSHATFDNTDSSPKFELVNDIDLESFNWEPIASSYDGDSFGGTFEGNGHTIDHFYLYRNITDFKTDNLYYGLFAHCEYATIQNFTIKGKAEIISHRPEGVSVSQGYDPVFGTVAGGTFFYSTLCDVYSYVDVSVEADDNSMSKAAGIVCFPGGEFNIQRCVNFGNITGDYMYAGGITILPMYPEGSIKDCANIGNMHSTLKYPDIENLISSGILVFVWNSIFFQDYLYMNMSDCYDYGTISGEPNMLCLPISTPITEMKNMTAENCYYIDAVTSPNDIGTPHTAEQFKSGETGYKLNSGVTDGTQAWYQNIDNGKTPDVILFRINHAARSTTLRARTAIPTIPTAILRSRPRNRRLLNPPQQNRQQLSRQALNPPQQNRQQSSLQQLNRRLQNRQQLSRQPLNLPLQNRQRNPPSRRPCLPAKATASKPMRSLSRSWRA